MVVVVWIVVVPLMRPKPHPDADTNTDRGAKPHVETGPEDRSVMPVVRCQAHAESVEEPEME